MKIKSQWLKILTLSAAALLAVSCKEQTAEIGKQAPELAAFDLQGNKADLAQWHGKKILLSFWSGNCGMCLAELKEVQKLAEQYPDKVKVISVNVNEDADIQALVKKFNIHLPVFKDQLKVSSERYDIKGTPTSFLIDEKGNIQAKFEGSIPNNELLNFFQG